MEFWKKQLDSFIVIHPKFNEPDSYIFTPNKGFKIFFLFEGTIKIGGNYGELEINLTDNELLIISDFSRTLRIPWRRLIGLEITLNN